jgi:CTP:molybdopterin cytidylyltransferase MocA
MGRDKALLKYRGTTFLGHLIAVLETRVDPLIVVLGHHANAIRETIPAGPRIIVNPGYKSGMLTSLQAGIRFLSAGADAALFTLVDHPAVQGATVDRLIAQFDEQQALLAIPRYGDRRGHPVIARRSILDEILALPPESSAKAVISAHRPETLFVDVDDAGILHDVDLPEQYDELGSS